MIDVLWIVASYFIGAIPFGVVIAKTFKGIDPRTAGSGNPGSTNVARLCGVPCGVLTLICDVLKGAVPVWLAIQMPDTVPMFPMGTALAAIMGHITSPFLGFKGGKGVATTIGALLPLAFLPLLCAVICCVAVIAVSNFVSLGSLTLIISLLVFYPFFGHADLLPLAMVLCAIIFWTHRANIRRLLSGEEKSWRKSKSGVAAPTSQKEE